MGNDYRDCDDPLAAARADIAHICGQVGMPERQTELLLERFDQLATIEWTRTEDGREELARQRTRNYINKRIKAGFN